MKKETNINATAKGEKKTVRFSEKVSSKKITLDNKTGVEKNHVTTEEKLQGFPKDLSRVRKRKDINNNEKYIQYDHILSSNLGQFFKNRGNWDLKFNNELIAAISVKEKFDEKKKNIQLMNLDGDQKNLIDFIFKTSRNNMQIENNLGYILKLHEMNEKDKGTLKLLSNSNDARKEIGEIFDFIFMIKNRVETEQNSIIDKQREKGIVDKESFTFDFKNTDHIKLLKQKMKEDFVEVIDDWHPSQSIEKHFKDIKVDDLKSGRAAAVLNENETFNQGEDVNKIDVQHPIKTNFLYNKEKTKLEKEQPEEKTREDFLKKYKELYNPTKVKYEHLKNSSIQRAIAFLDNESDHLSTFKDY